MSQVTLNSLKTKSSTAVQSNAPMDMQAGFSTMGGFELMQRGAKLLSSSTLVPAQYRAVVEKRDKYGALKSREENPAAISNCVIALNMAQRMNADPLMIMQNLYIVEGRPAWSSQYIIASINACGKYSPLRFDMTVLGEKDVKYSEIVRWENNKPVRENKTVRIDDIQCTAWCIERGTETRLEGPPVSIGMAVAEGWYAKNGSKWQTMPDIMLRYRAASFFGKLYAPELLMGIQTAEEVYDTTFDVERDASGAYVVSMGEIANSITTQKTPETSNVIAEEAQSNEEASLADLRKEAIALLQSTGMKNPYSCSLERLNRAQCTNIIKRATAHMQTTQQQAESDIIDMPQQEPQKEEPSFVPEEEQTVQSEETIFCEHKQNTIPLYTCKTCSMRKDCPSHI